MARPSHVHFMEKALELAQKGRGCVSPNPMVGAVVAHYGKIVAEGFHAKAGEDHAEVAALKKLDPQYVEGATLYVTLEPCDHQGKTPPCTEAILKSGIRRVVVGCRDPNPKVNGKGVARLKESGIEVIEQVLFEECHRLNAIYNKYITTGMPFVLLKVAMTLDGKIATVKGDSKWITNAKCRQYVHILREEVDAILIGGGTLRKDNPLLTVRLPQPKKKRQPTVIVVDETLEFPQKRNLFKVDREIIFMTGRQADLKQKEFLEKSGYSVWMFETDITGRIDPMLFLRRLGEKKMTSVLVEGGGGVYASFMEARAVDRIIAMIAPKMFGGQGRDWLPNIAIPTVKDSLSLKNISVKTIEDNIVLEGELS